MDPLPHYLLFLLGVVVAYSILFHVLSGWTRSMKGEVRRDGPE